MEVRQMRATKVRPPKYRVKRVKTGGAVKRLVRDGWEVVSVEGVTMLGFTTGHVTTLRKQK